MGMNIGKDCYIETRYISSEPYLITIGNNVQITSDVRFFTHGGDWIFRSKYPHIDTFGKIKVGNNVYIGNCALIMPGVTIGDNVLIGAGAVVTKSIESGKIVGGNPARVLGNVNDLEKKILGFNLKTKKMNYKEKRNFLLSLQEDQFIKK